MCTKVLSEITCPFPEDTPQSLLWNQQLEYASVKDKRMIRWHPVMIRWCISIFIKSPSAYDHLRDSGFLFLPSRRTLNKYISFTDAKAGFNPDVFQHLITLAEKNETKNIGLAHDEMKISAGLVYNKHTGRIVGFTDLGEINNELKDFEVSVNEESTVRPTATHVLTLMVRGIDFRLNYPIAYFAGAGVKAYELYHIVWEAIRILEFLDFKVWFVTCDGASANKKFFLMHANANNIKDGVVFWTQNKYAPDRRIYFICDVPHLLKTTRNNFANSHAHQNTRELFVSILNLQKLLQ